ncbi:MAG TPA: formate dehydrogenase subunit delta [Steroidobacteraceae bacterium]|jgi:formate dehydrogenase subunit delta|nr:formate dehydrogenase subunit delta [Steroidobacteraceae bacterium]
MTDPTGGTQAHAGAGHGTADHLVKMANDIGHFFRAEPQREDAIAGISNHIARYWTKRMREKIAAHMQHGGEGELDDLPREALRRLIAQQSPPTQPPAPQTAAR